MNAKALLELVQAHALMVEHQNCKHGNTPQGLLAEAEMIALSAFKQLELTGSVAESCVLLCFCAFVLCALCFVFCVLYVLSCFCFTLCVSYSCLLLTSLLRVLTCALLVSGCVFGRGFGTGNCCLCFPSLSFWATHIVVLAC